MSAAAGERTGDVSPQSAPRLLLAGYYGCGNAGDEAILAALLAGIRAALPRAHCTVATADPATTAAQHDVATVGREDIPELLSTMAACDLVLVGGGGIFADYWGVPVDRMLARGGGGLPYYAGLPVLAALAGTRSSIVAVGVGPLPTSESRTLTAEAFALAASASVRDRGSHALLTEVAPEIATRVAVTADPAFLLPALDPVRARELCARIGLGEGERPLAVALREWSQPPSAEGWLGEVAKALRAALARDPRRLLLLPFDRGDEPLHRELAHRLDDAHALRAPAGLAPAELAALIAASEGVLAMRFHAALFALLAGRVPVALAYDPKVSALLAEMGAAELAIAPQHWQAEAIGAALARAPTHPLRERLPALVVERRAAAARTIDPVVALLAAGRDRAPTGSPVLARVARDRMLAAWRSDVDLESTRAQMAAVQRTVDGLRRDADTARAELARVQADAGAERERWRQQRQWLTADLADASRRLAAVESTIGYRLLSRGWAIARRFLPEGSRRRWLYGVSRRAAARLVGGAPPIAATSTDAEATPRAAADWRADLLAFLDDVRERRPERLVAIFSGTTLDENEGQRPMQLALALARRGVPVLFVYWRWSATDAEMPQDRLADGIFQLPIDRIAERPELLFEACAGLAGEAIALFEFPWPGFFATLAAAHGAGWITLYDVIDDWEEFHRLGQAIWFDDPFERHLVAGCDAVFAINEPLAARVRALGGASVEVVPNGMRPGIERVQGPRPLARGAVTLGYFGYLAAAWFDWELVAAVGRARPEWRLYLIGYGGAPDGVSLPANVVLLGRQPQHELAAYAANWDVAMVPFRADRLAAGADPIKTYEYLAMGLPVVTTGVSAPVGAEQVVHQARTMAEFLALVEAAARQAHEPQERAARRAVAAQCTWDRRLASMLDVVERGAQRVSQKRALLAVTPDRPALPSPTPLSA